jgi:peptidoglycan/LPS O-acetylase OafA/YrhL
MTAADPRHERSPELDLFRFIAASAVLLFHYTYRPEIHGVPSPTVFGSVQQISRYGYLGVPLFFLISGFVIVWSAQGRTAGQFALARFRRLYPMFWVGVAMTLAVLLLTGRRPELLHPRVIAANLTMLPGRFGEPAIDGVYWTLAIELKLYLGIAILIALRQMRRLEYWLYAWLVGIVLAMALPRVHVLTSLTTAPYSSYFVGGAVCYLIRSSGLTVPRAFALLTCLAASCWQGLGAISEFTHDPGLASPSTVMATITLCYAAVGGVAVGAVRLPRLGLWYSLGNLTYPLYLLHNVIGKEVFASLEPSLGDWIRLLVIGCIVYTLAAISARWIEPWARSLCNGLFKYANRFVVRVAGL